MDALPQSLTAPTPPRADLLERLASVGLTLTATLDLEGVFQALRGQAHALLDATSFMLWWRDADGQGLTLRLGDEHGKALPPSHVSWRDPGSNVARCARECVEVVLGVPAGTDNAQHMPGTEVMLSALFGPLVVGSQVMGVLSVQSPREHAYGDVERQLFRTLCAFGAIGVNNAEAYAAMVRAQEDLDAAQQRYKDVIERVSEAICIYQDNRIVLCNSRACRLTGYPRDELMGKTFERTTYVGDVPATSAWIRSHLKGQPTARHHRFRALRKDGKTVWTEASMEVIRWNGRVAALGVFTDLTERMVSEQALRRSEELHRALVNHATEGILVVQEGRVVFANPRAEAITGAALTDRAAERFFAMLDDEGRRPVEEHYRRLLEKGKDSHCAGNGAVRLRAETGQTRWLELSAVCVEWEHQLGLLVFLNDVTRCAELERKVTGRAAGEA